MSETSHATPDRTSLQEITTFARALARAGGRIALLHYGQANPQVKFDESLVTQSELAVQEHLRREVAENFPTHRFWGDEVEALTESGEDTCLWVVDPIDGTSAFSNGYPSWGISLSVFHNNRPLVGVFYLPVTIEMYSATVGDRAYMNDERISARSDEIIDNESLLLTYSRFHNDFNTNFPGKVRSLGSSVAHICYVARGAASGAVLKNVHLWDVVSGQVVLAAAGGEIRDLDGKLFEPADYLEQSRIDKVLLATAKGQFKDVKRCLSRL